MASNTKSGSLESIEFTLDELTYESLDMKSLPTSPSSDSSNRSEWFRQSVLFWSNHTEEQICPDGTIENNRLRKTSSSLSMSQESLPLLNDPIRELSTEHKTSQSWSENDTDVKIKHNRNVTEFDPSELLRQVEELESCFARTPTLQSLNSSSKETFDDKEQVVSPHLTLEFPTGSSIKDNPLYIQAQQRYQDDTKETLKKEIELPKEKNKFLLDEEDFNVKILLDIVETAVASTKQKQESLQPDVKSNKIEESHLLPTRLIEEKDKINIDYNDTTSLIHQLPNEKSLFDEVTELNNDWINNSNVEDNRLSSDNNGNLNTLMNFDDIVSDKTQNITQEISNKEFIETDTKSRTTVNEVFITNVDETDVNCSIDEVITEISQSNTIANQNIVEGVEKVQDTLNEINNELHSNHTVGENTKRDPDAVMRSLLSQIKPPTESRSNISQSLSIDNLDTLLSLPRDSVTMATSIDFNDEKLANEEFPENTINFNFRNEVLLKQIDQLIDIENNEKKLKSNRVNIKKTRWKGNNQLERIDSGLHSTSSDSNSPYSSPMAARSLQSTDLSGLEIQHEIILESLQEYRDSVFNDDSDFSSDWSPISTLESSVASSTRTRSNSVPRSQFKTANYLRDTRHSVGNISDSNIPKNSKIYSDSELNAIRKFLTLTSRCFDNGNGSINTAQSLEELALLPCIKESLDVQRRELHKQRLKQEEFLQQLGDLLIQIVSLKEEHSTVRSKQAKALSLLKKQLDMIKKNQSKSHSEVLDQVNSLSDKVNTSLSFSAEHIASTSPLMSPMKCNTPPTNSIRNQGQIIWKIGDVMKKLTRIKSGLIDGAVVSQPFQTNEYGYRMNGWVYLNGRGKMVGKYVSVYVCVLVGEYDAILSWPIRPTYTFTLIDQKGHTSKRHNNVKVRRVFDIAGKGANVISQKGGIPRPSDGTKALIVGFDDFIEHEKLLERRYLADDVLFLKIEAEVE